MAKVEPEKSQNDQFGGDVRTQYGNFNTNYMYNAWVEPTAPPMDEETVREQPRPQQIQFLPMPEPGPVYRPTHVQPHFQPQQPQTPEYQAQSSAFNDQQEQPSFLPMPEPGPVLQLQYPGSSIQSQQPPAPLNEQRHEEAPPSYYESQLAQDPSNKFRNDIFQSINRLNTLKSQILQREERLNQLQRRSEIQDGVQFPDFSLVTRFEQEMNHLDACFRAAQQHLKELGETERFIPGTRRKKLKIHINSGSCCGTEDHYYRDLCDKKPKIHIEGMCNSPDIFAQTCEQQNHHTGWIWGKQKLQIDGMWVSPKIHLKGLLQNPLIKVDGMLNKPEIHLEGICLNPEIRVEGMGVHPTIRITGLCHNLKLHIEGMFCRPRINIDGICDRIEASMSGMCTGASVMITGACKNLKRCLGMSSPSAKFKGNDLFIRI